MSSKPCVKDRLKWSDLDGLCPGVAALDNTQARSLQEPGEGSAFIVVFSQKQVTGAGEAQPWPPRTGRILAATLLLWDPIVGWGTSRGPQGAAAPATSTGPRWPHGRGSVWALASLLPEPHVTLVFRVESEEKRVGGEGAPWSGRLS